MAVVIVHILRRGVGIPHVNTVPQTPAAGNRTGCGGGRVALHSGEELAGAVADGTKEDALLADGVGPSGVNRWGG